MPSKEAARLSPNIMQHLTNPLFGQEGSKLGTYNALETVLPWRCRHSRYAEDLCWIRVCHHYPLLIWKRVAMYQYFCRKWIELFIIFYDKQHMVSSPHCISQIWQKIHFHSAHKAKCYLTLKKKMMMLLPIATMQWNKKEFHPSE